MINKRTLSKYFAASATCSVCCSAQAQAQNIQVESCMLSGASANRMLDLRLNKNKTASYPG